MLLRERQSENQIPIDENGSFFQYIFCFAPHYEMLCKIAKWKIL